MLPPRPSLGYLSNCTKSNSGPNTTASSKSTKKLIILDLNGTIINKKSRNTSQRPHLVDFKSFLFRNFSVIVYSSAMYKNVQRYVQSAFDVEQQSRLLAVYSRENMQMSSNDFKNKVQTYKDLEMIWRKHKEYDQNNTILIDDSSTKAALQPFNLFLLSTWDDSKDDSMMIAIIGLLDEIKNCENVSNYFMKYQHIKTADKDADISIPWFENPVVYAFWLEKGKKLIHLDGILDNIANLSLSH